MRIGINGFGRIGRLALRAGWGHPDLEFVHINEIKGGVETSAHLVKYDSVHGRWQPSVSVIDNKIQIEKVLKCGFGNQIGYVAVVCTCNFLRIVYDIVSIDNLSKKIIRTGLRTYIRISIYVFVRNLVIKYCTRCK